MASYTYEFIELGDEHSLGCKCCRASQGIDLPVPQTLSDEEIKNEARKFAHSIFVDWTKLNAILKRFECTIHKRWIKKNPKQRREILLRAWPDIPTKHRPDFAGFRNVNKTAPRSRTCQSAAYLRPYINLEDLQQRNLLLLFLSSRGRNLPDVFSCADFEAAHLGHGWELNADKDSTCLVLRGQRSPRTYGRLLPPGQTKGKGKPKRQSEGHVPISGLLVLEIQQGIYSFLCACAESVLHDFSFTTRQYFLAPHEPTPKVPEVSNGEWPSLTTHMLEAVYREPQKLDLDRLKTLVSARRSAAEDHVWFLREDPGYFVETLKEWKEHNSQLLQHLCLIHWKAVAADMISESLTCFLFWHRIYEILNELTPLASQCSQTGWHESSFSEDEKLKWAELLDVTHMFMNTPLNLITSGFPTSPRMRHCYSHGSKDGWVTKRILNEPERRADMLFYAITNEGQRGLHSGHLLVQEIQYMLDTDPITSRLIDPWITGHFSDLAMLSEVMMRIDSVEPWPASRECEYRRKMENTSKSFRELIYLDIRLRRAVPHACCESEIFCDPMTGVYEYPVAKRYTEANVAQMRSAQMCLLMFWAEVEVHVADETGISIAAALERRSFEQHGVSLIPKWVPPIVPQKQSILSELDANASRFHDVSARADPRTPIERKTKIKTRGVPVTPSNVGDGSRRPPEPEVEESKPVGPTMKVSKRALKVFSALLPGPNAENHQRVEVAWDELLQAMNNVGLQPEKLYGSVWIFRPKAGAECKVDVKRSIQFHEPKEVRKGSKIPPRMVRTFGRRLKHTYGWESGMFVCE